MGDQKKSPTQRNADEPRGAEEPEDQEQGGFAADLRRLKEALGASRPFARREPHPEGLRSQGAVGLVARADATLPPRRAARVDEEDKNDEAIEKNEA